MKRQEREIISSGLQRILLLLLCLSLSILASFSSIYAADQLPEQKHVKVGWHEAPYFITDRTGRRSGYSYEYQRKVAAYTGWDCEYVEGTWSELFQKLKDGEIDLMSNVSYMEERADYMLFPTLPMGTESYYVFVSPDNTEIKADDYTSLNGKRVGVTKSSIQRDLFLSWAQMHGVEAELVDTSCTDEEALALLGKEYDAFVTMDIYGNPETAVPICKIGSSDFYFAVNKERPDLLADLNAAMNRIQDENKYYNQQLHEKYLSSSDTDRYLMPEELNWLVNHGTIRVGYQDNYLAFCAQDPATGELTGALKSFLDDASTALENAYLSFEPVVYPTAAAAMEALKKGEIDCVFPANLTDYDSEELSLFMTPALMRTEMDAVVRESEQKEFVVKNDVSVAVNEGNTNYDRFLADHYPGWQREYFKDTPAGLKAVAAGEVDCVIISNYRFSNISKLCESLHLTTVYTGVDMDYCLAVLAGEKELYSILARTIQAVPDATVHTALTYYSTEDVKTSFIDLIKENLFIILAVIAVIMLVILILLLRNIQVEKKVLEEEHLVNDLNKRVFVDALTHVRNKGGFDDYIDKLEQQRESEEKFEYAIGVFDCDDLKRINDTYGHDKGNVYLTSASRLICKIFQHSPVFRIGGDEFSVVLLNDDYQNREQLVRQFSAESEEICAAAQNPWEEVHISMGVAVYNPETDHSVNDTVRRADRLMYENKRRTKKNL